MSIGIIVSYDGTANDDDALALARLLAVGGATLALAYVRHSREYDPRREEIAQHDAERRLEQGAVWLGDPDIPRHVVVNPSTADGLSQLAASEGASIIVFGSDYRTPPGRVEPGSSAQGLLEGGPIAVAVAEAGLRTHTDGALKTILVSAPEADTAGRQTAESLAAASGATIVPEGSGDADLIVVGSQSSAPAGRIALSGSTRGQLDSAHSSALVVPHGTPVLY